MDVSKLGTLLFSRVCLKHEGEKSIYQTTKEVLLHGNMYFLRMPLFGGF